MNVLVGVDSAGHYRKATGLLTRLRFPGAKAHLLHVVEPLAPMPSPFTPGFLPPVEDFVEERLQAGRELLDVAEEDIYPTMSVIGKQVVYGYPGQELLNQSQALKSDLVVVGTTNIGRINSAFMGSVSRCILNGEHCSGLFGKHASSEAGGLTAVLATDHSAYMKRCVDEFVKMAPSGIEKLIVLTVNLFNEDQAEELLRKMPALACSANNWVGARLLERNEEVINPLVKQGLKCESRVEGGSVEEAIGRVMSETHADLLILGAQGHSFIERLRTGSTSFAEVLLTNHSVLMLRTRD